MSSIYYFVATESDYRKAVADRIMLDPAEAQKFCKESNEWAKKELFHVYQLVSKRVESTPAPKDLPAPIESPAEVVPTEEPDLSLRDINQKLREHQGPKPVRRFTPKQAPIPPVLFDEHRSSLDSPYFPEAPDTKQEPPPEKAYIPTRKGRNR
jgi:hypothetical protein